MSAKHAVVTCEVKDAEASPPELEVKIVDLSRNGVTLNGVKLKKDEYVALKDGDVVTLPFHLEYRFELNPEGTPPRSTCALLNGAPTPLQLKKRSPGASVGDGREDGSNSKRARGVDGADAEALREANQANETLRRRVEELEKALEAEAVDERRKQSDETNDAEVVDELERKLASAEERAVKAENELDEAKRVVENAAAATKELETKLAETTASKATLETSLEVAEARRVEEIEMLKSEHASVVESLRARGGRRRRDGAAQRIARARQGATRKERTRRSRIARIGKATVR